MTISKNRPVLAVDLDGVCADYMSALKASVAREFNVPVESLEDPLTYEFENWGFHDRAHYQELHSKTVDEDQIYSNLELIPGAVETLKELSDKEVHIHIVTSRFVVHHQNAKVVTQTVEWLDKVGIPYRDISFLRQKELLDADLFIDDAPYNIEALRGAGRDAVVFTASYNKEVDGLRADNWDDVKRIVVEKFSL